VHRVAAVAELGSLGGVAHVKTRSAFFLSLAFVLVGLSLRLGALGQFQEGYRIRAQSGQRDFPAQQSRRGAALLYASLPFAIASAVYAFVSYRRRCRLGVGSQLACLASTYLSVLRQHDDAA